MISHAVSQVADSAPNVQPESGAAVGETVDTALGAEVGLSVAP